MHTVREDVALKIRDAIENGKPLIEIDIDLFGSPTSSRRTLLATRHVIALAECAPTESAPLGPKIRRLRST